MTKATNNKKTHGLVDNKNAAKPEHEKRKARHTAFNDAAWEALGKAADALGKKRPDLIREAALAAIDYK